MSKLLVRSFAMSIDGYGAGPNQDLSIRWASAAPS